MKKIIYILIAVLMSASQVFSDVEKLSETSIKESKEVTEIKEVTYDITYLKNQKEHIQKDMDRVRAELVEINRLIDAAKALGVQETVQSSGEPEK